ncbi:cytochrome P450 [Hypoxylon rubiginosum]|uniref:Cytochrome P450 n=1 Tax=Hypoxylon rubiginosum TaxID=110542 RepID=A0ACB9ZDA8_9PEZI|nr:cytochrome P450 [Hypoxylon rubiginosum]
MSFHFHIPRLLPQTAQDQDVGIIVLTAVLAYIGARCIYLLHFHPLSKFPGPKLAAVSNVWYAYHWLSGRWPWAVEAAIKQYGDVVRVAPNELAFGDPRAAEDIYSSHDKSLETFVKTDIHDFAKENDGGLIWQQDPLKHRQIAKQVAPAFSQKAIRASDPVIHHYVDLFVSRMKEIGNTQGGISLANWTQWLAMDIAAEMAYSHRVDCMKEAKNSAYLNAVLSFNKFATMTQVLTRFPWLGFMRFAVFPVSLLGKLMQLRKESLASMHRRLSLQGATEHADYFDQLAPAVGHAGDNSDEILHLSKISTQLMFAGYLPPSDWYYGTFFHLLHARQALEALTREVRAAFTSYEEITPGAAQQLPYLNACMKEALRLFPTSASINGMPVYSPGAVVGGDYIPRSTTCQFSGFSVARNPRYFRDPLLYRPQRWLPADHSLYSERYSGDQLDAFMPFSQGPRMCSGKEVAWWQARLVLTKVLWSLDLEMVPGQRVDLEKNLKGWGYWVKPELKVRFIAVDRQVSPG